MFIQLRAGAAFTDMQGREIDLRHQLPTERIAESVFNSATVDPHTQQSGAFRPSRTRITFWLVDGSSPRTDSQ